MQIFEEVLLFKLRTTEKTENQTISLVPQRSRFSAYLSWPELLISCLFFCFSVVPSLRKTTSSKLCTFCRFVQLKSVLLISCVFWIFFFFRTLPVSSVSDFSVHVLSKKKKKKEKKKREEKSHILLQYYPPIRQLHHSDFGD